MARRRKSSCANPTCRAICVPGPRGLCAKCLPEYRAQHDRERIGKRERSHYDAAWRKRSKREIAEHVALYGYICSNDCGSADPESNPLTLDHVVARDDTVTAVLCRRCNSSKGNRKVNDA